MCGWTSDLFNTVDARLNDYWLTRATAVARDIPGANEVYQLRLASNKRMMSKYFCSLQNYPGIH